MDFFVEHVLVTLKDDKSRSFSLLLDEVGFSHNTLQQLLEGLVAQGLVVKEKMVSNRMGRPKFAYRASSRTIKQVAVALEDPGARSWLCFSVV